MLQYDPRSISSQVYQSLKKLKDETPNQSDQKEQKSQAVELYNYIATWGLLRLKAEEVAIKQTNKQNTVKCFFKTLTKVGFPDIHSHPLSSKNKDKEKESEGIECLTQYSTSEYLSLTALALQVAREFAFWAEAVYADLKNT